MVGLLSWLKRKDDSDWEKALAVLDERIRHAEIRLSELHMRERKLKFAWLYYSIPVYVFVLVAYFTYLKPRGDPWDIWLWKTGFVVLGAPCIYIVHRLIRYWYSTKEKHELEYLENLKAKQKEKIEDLKKKTAYYKTKGLIERYDTPTKERMRNKPQPGTPMQTPNAAQVLTKPSTLSQRLEPSSTPQMVASMNTPVTPFPVDRPSPLSPTPDINMMIPARGAHTPSPKGWFDKVIDIMIGESEGPASKYALICEECFTHNGLVPPDAYATARFRCMKCDHLNAPKSYEHLGFGDSRRSQDMDSPTASLLKRHRASVPDELLFAKSAYGQELRRRSNLQSSEESETQQVAERGPTPPLESQDSADTGMVGSIEDLHEPQETEKEE
ncbi:uncharacterized protein SPPG_03037 [Spizellomyces punctatus DAOM BR117]|uniref:Endoplasmic reticulum junction formation protein lunapark n=1 Tax=Spizellomyces punctatus (strain DAOM BR117) TaxID=645134 RepID=A0A0L0HP64_SPIPD|nr:uncharacterized protein SPPG_03037 [Spizellomyces punctatus DAOM BR117]KND02579.1 hypothetical protein SPPG_03037 [Spizellomyces punctatus DAOM BR117]|eukprot:XP_016610618.1 hypothetical protein SPPG_03037 [Spizellomyces punctatus DAOM BR117]